MVFRRPLRHQSSTTTISCRFESSVGFVQLYSWCWNSWRGFVVGICIDPRTVAWLGPFSLQFLEWTLQFAWKANYDLSQAKSFLPPPGQTGRRTGGGTILNLSVRPPSVRLFMCPLPNLWTRNFENKLTAFDENWHKWSRSTGQGHVTVNCGIHEV